MRLCRCKNPLSRRMPRGVGDGLSDLVIASELLLKRSKLEEKLGKYPQALRWAARAGKAVAGLAGNEPARQAARTSAWYATVLQAEGHTPVTIPWIYARPWSSIYCVVAGARSGPSVDR